MFKHSTFQFRVNFFLSLNIPDLYEETGEFLGNGSYASVKTYRNKETGKECAVKVRMKSYCGCEINKFKNVSINIDLFKWIVWFFFFFVFFFNALFVYQYGHFGKHFIYMLVLCQWWPLKFFFYVVRHVIKNFFLISLLYLFTILKNGLWTTILKSVLVVHFSL